MKPEHWITIAIAAATAIGYSMAYCYEFGFCSIFGIPTYLIQIDTTSILTSISKVFIFYVFATPLFLIGLFLLGDGTNKLNAAFARLMMVLSLTIPVIIVFFSADWSTRFGPAIAYSIIWAIFEIPSYYKLRNKNEISSYYKFIDRGKPATFRLYSIFAVILLLFTFFLIYSQGKTEASAQDKFFTVSSNETVLVLRIYGEHLVCTDNISPANSRGVERKIGDLLIIDMTSIPNPRLIQKAK